MTDLEELELSENLLNLLRRRGVNTLEEVLERGEEGMLGLHGFGPASWKKLEDKLRQYFDRNRRELLTSLGVRDSAVLEELVQLEDWDLVMAVWMIGHQGPRETRKNSTSG